MKILKIEFQGLPFNDGKTVEIDFTPSKRVSLDIDEEVFELSPKIQTFNVLSFYGMNATGKTSVLKIIEFAYGIYLQKLSVQELRNMIFLFTKNVSLKTVIANNGMIYNTYMEIVGNEIKKEQIVGFDANLIKSKKMLNKLSFVNTQEEVEKVGLLKEEYTYYDLDQFNKVDSNVENEMIFSDYVKKQVLGSRSIINLIPNNKFNSSEIVRSTMRRTNFNMYAFPTAGISNEIINKVAKLLDNNIEAITYIEDDKDEIDVKIKFVKQKEINTKYRHMEEYLSAGTIRGLNIFQDAFQVLTNGGILLVDEIDLNLNLSIVEQIILLFKNKSINKQNASLIFTTHVPTLIDLFDRDDNIYIMKKEYSDVELRRLSEYKLRYDKLKSNSLISGEIGTNPNYDAYISVLSEVFDNE